MIPQEDYQKLCASKLRNYADTEFRSLNPFKFNWFRKEKLKNHQSAHELALLLSQPVVVDDDLIKIAQSIHKFDDAVLQEALLDYLNQEINDSSASLFSKRKNITLLTQTLQVLMDKYYKPWWTLHLISVPYYSQTLREIASVFIYKITSMFSVRRAKSKENLLSAYSNEIITNQIIERYKTLDTNNGQKKELNSILELTLDNATDTIQKELIHELKNNLLENVPFGKIIISTTVFSYIVSTYLAKKENRQKSKQVQAGEIIEIIGTVFLKTNTSHLIKSMAPGIGDIADAVASVLISKSSANPLDKDRKLTAAAASVAGGALGGALAGMVLPVIGTPIGVCFGAAVSRTFIDRFYKVVEDWQTASSGEQSVLPRYSKSIVAFRDNDARNILNPLYLKYLETEEQSKQIGEELAKWMCISTLHYNSNNTNPIEALEIIDEEIMRLKNAFKQLKNDHGKTIKHLYSLNPDNPQRVEDYSTILKGYLDNLHKPVKMMLKEYDSFTASNNNSYNKMLPDMPQTSSVQMDVIQPSNLVLFESSILNSHTDEQYNSNMSCR